MSQPRSTEGRLHKEHRKKNVQGRKKILKERKKNQFVKEAIGGGSRGGEKAPAGKMGDGDHQ